MSDSNDSVETFVYPPKQRHNVSTNQQEQGDYPPAVVVNQRASTLLPRPLSIVAQDHNDNTTISKRTTIIRDHDNDPNLITWDSPQDPANPQNLSRTTKWMYTVICCVITINCSFASSAPSTTLEDVSRTYEVSSTVAALVVSVYLCGYIPGPIIWGPSSELIGRRLLFLVSLAGFTLTNLGCALAKNFETLIVLRFLSGVFAAAPMTNGSGLIVDIWEPRWRGTAMNIYSASVFLGPVLGPLVGGFVTQSSLKWRFIYWLQMIYGGVCFILCLLVRETYAPVLLSRKAKALRKSDPEGNSAKYAAHEKSDWSIRGILERTLFRPFHMLLVEPTLLLVTIYMAYVYGLLYATLGVFPIIWEDVRNFSQAKAGLIFIGVGIGTTLGGVVHEITQKDHEELVIRWNGSPPPENDLKSALYGGPAIVVGLFWLSWTGAFASVPWYVPAIATIPLGMGFSMIFVSFMTYMVSTYMMFAASAFAANTMVRSAVGAGFPLFINQMFHNLGIQWAGTLLGCLAIIVTPIPFLFCRYGPRLREHSKFAPALDVQLANKNSDVKKIDNLV